MIEEIWKALCLRSCLVVRWQRWADTNVTLAFKDAKVIPPFSKEETDPYYTEYTYDKDDTNDTDDTDDTDNTGICWNRLE